MDAKKKRIGIIVGVVVAVIAVAAIVWYTQVKMPYDAAAAEYAPIQQSIAAKNAELDAAIQKAQDQLSSTETPYDESTKTDLQVSVSTAQEAEVSVPETPKDTAEAKSLTEQYQGGVDYTSELADLDTKTQALSNSYKAMEQVTAPAESFVVTRLTGLPNVVDIEAATEDKDPNKKMNKEGGYTAAVFFTSDLVDSSEVYSTGEYGDGPLDKGTDGGGCIEVYKTTDDATARDTYLSAFDNTGFSSGYHEVVGTIVVRVSDNLTATQQSTLAQSIVDSLTKVE